MILSMNVAYNLFWKILSSSNFEEKGFILRPLVRIYYKNKRNTKNSTSAKFPQFYLIKKKNNGVSNQISAKLKILNTGIFFLFIGFFFATSLTTIIGSIAAWDPFAAAILIFWLEFFNKFFYSQEKSFIFSYINSFKIGLTLGLFTDAFKLTG